MKIWIERDIDGVVHLHTIEPIVVAMDLTPSMRSVWAGPASVDNPEIIEVFMLQIEIPPFPLLIEVEEFRPVCVWAPADRKLPRGWEYVE